MAIIGFNIKKILVERKKLVRGEVKVNTKMNITDVKKQPVKITKGKDVLSFDFDFAIFYKGVADHIGGVADIIFEGNVLYLTDPKDTTQILDAWKKKEIPADVRIRILNTILAKCNIKALVLEEDLGLPPHIPLPRFQEKGKKEEKPKKK
ncbi:MAG: hypothetical protein IB618_03170 [Candidatus Pacearchaeota archaeon]|nr:MAG: hypothetical protein IB618_03170 [Candidatus Pacearchaeota archaeon]